MFGFGTGQAVKRQGPRGHFDLPLLLGLVGLASMGVVMVASSSIAVADSQHIGAFYYLKKHLFYLALGLVLAGLAMRTELKQVEKYAFPLLLVGGAMLLAVFVPHLGMRINGARRWLNFVVLSFQPVEAV
ncbi:MAG: FtsW/RodA/SpoVE family cell cycle protein, partial [Dyella sp.]|uniref:FtsW/RodA/SpoVE family cell cycle protein n=1 Tax=Dyella sp. TaxID=1869338 RepID=UPI003F81B7DB